MITVRHIVAEDMPELRAWATRRGCELRDEWLSPHGLLALLDGKPLLCAWAATILETSLMEIDHVYASPRCPKSAGLEAWASLIAHFRELARLIGESGGRKVTGFKISANSKMAPFVRATGGAVGEMARVNCFYPA
jgi:hypothetical protein